MRFFRRNGRIIPIHDDKQGHKLAASVGAVAAGGVAYSQRDKLTGVRTVYHGPRNRLRVFETKLSQAYAWETPKPTSTDVANRFKLLMEQQGIKPVSGDYYQKLNDRSGRIYTKSEFPKSGKKVPVTFVSSKNTGMFDSSYPKLKAAHIRMGEHEFQRKFVRERSFIPSDDLYHRPLRKELYKDIPDSETARHAVDLSSLKTYAKARMGSIHDRLFPQRINHISGRKFFVANEWGKKGLTRKHRLSNIRDTVKDVGRDLSPLNPSYEHAYFTRHNISPRRIIGSTRFKEPGVRLINIMANKPRVLGAVGATVAAGITGYSVAKYIHGKIHGSDKNG